MNTKRHLYGLLALLIIAHPLGAKTQASVSAAPSQVTIGDIVTLRFIVQTDRVHDTFQVVADGDGEKWEVLKRNELPQREMDGFVILETHIQAAFFRVGSHNLGPFHVKLIRNNQVVEEIETRTLSITVNSVLDDSNSELAPLKDPLPVSGDPVYLLPWLGGVLLLLLLIILVLWLRRRFRKSGEIPGPPELSPLQELEEALRNLMKLGLFGKGRVREFCLRLTPIIKGFLNRSYGFNAEDLTSTETISLLFEKEKDPRLTDLFSLLLDLSDRVKFARFEPGPAGEAKLEKAMEELIGIYRRRETVTEESHVPPAE